MTSVMVRESSPNLSVNVALLVADATEIDMRGFAGGSLQLPAASGTTQITVYSQLGSEAWAIAKDDENGDIIMAVTAGKPRPLHPSVYNYPRVKFVATVGTATANVPVFLKS